MAFACFKQLFHELVAPAIAYFSVFACFKQLFLAIWQICLRVGELRNLVKKASGRDLTNLPKKRRTEKFSKKDELSRSDKLA